MSVFLPVWERHAWGFLSPCTEGMRCSKCGIEVDGSESHLRETGPCPAPPVSGPVFRLPTWSCARPVWTLLWPDGQHQHLDADYEEHAVALLRLELQHRPLTPVERGRLARVRARLFGGEP